MKIKAKRNLLTVILSVLCAVMLCCSVGMISGANGKTATAKTPTASDIVIGEIAPNAGVASASNNLKSLYSVLSGGNATGKKSLQDLETHFNSNAHTVKGTGSEVKALNTSDFGTNIYVTLGGIQWNVVFLTLNNSGELILDLWQTEPTVDNVPFSDGASINDYNLNNPSCIYGTSYIRSQVLGNGGDYYNYNNPSSPVLKSSDPTSSEYYEFAQGKYSEFFEVPANLEYQEKQNAIEAGIHGNNFPNEAWGIPSNESGWGGTNYGSTGMNKNGYSNWKNDKIWLPSFTEIYNGIWGDAGARRTDSPSITWSRAGMHAYSSAPSSVCCFKPDGVFYGAGCDTSSNLHAVRPAVHLNFKKLGYNVEDVETIYNGSAQTIADVAADDKGWFDGNAMTLTYPSGMTTVGDYQVKAELTQAVINEGLTFVGEPDTSIGESESVRYFKFTIKPKPLDATLSESDGTVTLTIDENGLCGSDEMPNTAIQYTSTDGRGYNSTTAPQQKGDFKAEPKITDANSNYSLNCTPASVTFTIDSIKVTLPTLPPTGTPEYDGTQQTLAFTNYTHNGKGVSIYSVSGKTPGGKAVATNPTFDKDKGEITFKDAGTYTVTFTLEDSANCVWKDDGGTGRKTVDVTVNPKQLGLTVGNDNGDLWGWGVGTAVKATVTLTGIISGDNLKLTTNYTATSTGSEVKSNGTSNNGAETVSDEFELTDKLEQGDYTLSAEIDNENYSITDGLAGANMPLTFTIGAQVFDPDTFAWTYSENNATGKQPIADGDSFLKYKLDAAGKPFQYTLSINLGAHAGVFQTLTDTDYTDHKQTDAGTYVTTVRLRIKNADYSFDTNKTYTNATIISTTEADVFINWTIEKGDFTDLDKQGWVYRYGASGSWTDYNATRPPEFGNGTVTVKMKGDVEGTLKGLTFNYGGINSERNKGKYTVKMSFGVTDTKNFNIPQGFNFEWEITKKIISVQWEQDVAITYNGTEHPEWKGNEYYATQLRYDKAEYADKVEYIYSCTLPDGTEYSGRGIEALAYITEQALAAQRRLEVNVTVELKSDASIQNDYDLIDTTGGDFSTSFVVGDSKLVAKVELTANGEYGNFEYKLEVKGEDMDSSKYEVKIYKGTNISNIDDPENVLIENFDPNTADAGDYIAVVTLKGNWADEYRLTGAKKPFKINQKSIPVPTLSDVVFTGGDVSILDYLGGSWAEYKDVITVEGEFEGIRNVREGGYVATLTLTNVNYKWDYGTGEAAVRYALTAKNAASEVIAEGSDSVASYKWNVTPLVIDTTELWNKSKGGATLNLPQNVQNLIAGETLTIGYKYYDGASGEALEEVEFKGGKQFKVEAVMGGFDAENGNVVFKNSDTEFGAVSNSINYTVPQSGAAAAFGKVKDFVTKTWMGLPIWAWMLIALAILILLIIIIVVACKKRKSKEEREAIKAAKEEEKQRREEERRQKEEEREEEKRRREEERAEEKRRRDEEREEERRRREEEREAAKAKQEAELELAKAKQEAELARIKAEAAAASAMPAAAMAATALAQPQAQAQPQQVQQPVQQVQQVPVADNSAIAKLEAEIAMLRAENKAQQQAQQNNNAQPAADPTALARIEAELAALRAENRANHNSAMPMQQPMMQMPMQMQQPMMPSYSGDINTEMRARLAEERARTAEDRLFRTTEQRALLAEDRLARGVNNMPQQPVMMQMPMQQPMMQMPMQMQQPQPQPVQQPVQTVFVPAQQPQGSANADTFGAVLASMFKSLTDSNREIKPEQATRQIEAESKPVSVNNPVVYPADAVVTTTTTVDTTKSSPQRIQRDTNFDIDGFYEAFDEK